MNSTIANRIALLKTHAALMRSGVATLNDVLFVQISGADEFLELRRALGVSSAPEPRFDNSAELADRQRFSAYESERVGDQHEDEGFARSTSTQLVAVSSSPAETIFAPLAKPTALELKADRDLQSVRTNRDARQVFRVAVPLQLVPESENLEAGLRSLKIKLDKDLRESTVKEIFLDCRYTDFTWETCAT